MVSTNKKNKRTNASDLQRLLDDVPDLVVVDPPQNHFDDCNNILYDR